MNFNVFSSLSYFSNLSAQTSARVMSDQELSDHEEAQDLELIGIADEEESNVCRRIESMSTKQTKTTIAMFFVTNLFILCMLFFGPSLIVVRPYKFDAPANQAIRSKRFTFEMTGFHVFHSFVAVDLMFERAANEVVDPFNVSISVYTVTNIHATKEDNAAPTLLWNNIGFEGDSLTSDRYRIYVTNLVDFVDIHCWVAMKYHLVPNSILPRGRFEWYYGDPAHAVLQVFLRFVLFVLGLLVLVRLLMSDFSLKHSHISMRIMFFLDVCLIVASNPLYILTFFASDKTFRVVDSLLANFLAHCCLFTAFAILVMGNLIHRDVSFSWIVIRFIPFGLSFLVMASALIYYHSLLEADPLGQTTNVSFFFIVVKEIVYAIYFTGYVIASVDIFKAETVNEKTIMVSLGLGFFLSMCLSEAASTLVGYVELQFANQIFNLLVMGSYIMFFNYVNWPTDKSAAVQEDEQKTTGNDALINDLQNEPEGTNVN